MTMTQLKTPEKAQASFRGQKRFSIMLVGGGPNSLYCIERLLAQIVHQPDLAPQIALSVVDIRGAFGAGCHYPTQPTTNHLNRIASQISFCADQSNKGHITSLLPEELRLTLHSWCQQRYSKTKNERYEVSEREWVERSLFGEASCDVFQTYTEELRKRGVPVDTITDKVVGMVRNESGYRIAFQSVRPDENHDAVVLCTGHLGTKPRPGEKSATFASHAEATPGVRYIHNVYPVENIDAQSVPTGETVVCQGLGLAAIDVMLRLTEGRGGYFAPTGDAVRPLRYERSGFEPKTIFPFSSTGVFLFARAYNEKLNDADLFETGSFFTSEAVDELRRTVGIEGPQMPQLDFAAHVLPLMIVEMQRIYYETLFGKSAFAEIGEKIKAATESFIAGQIVSQDALSRIATDHFAALSQRLELVLAEGGELSASDLAALMVFCRVYSGKALVSGDSSLDELRSILDQDSPYLHDPRPSAHLFDWEGLIDPLREYHNADKQTLGAVAHRFFLKDLADATQGNISNPRKAAIDGVWRDMRDTVRYSVEFGGLLPDSQRHFMHVVHRTTNRIAVGTSLKMMTKLMALVDAGVIDLSCGLSPSLTMTENGFTLSRGADQVGIEGQVLVNANVHRFDLGQTEDRLYRTLLEGGLIREWRVTSGADPLQTFATGGVEVDPATNLVIQEDGHINTNLGLLGAPSEGPLYFHLAAMRPYCSDPVIADADKVINALLQRLPTTGTTASNTQMEETIQ